MKNKIVGSIYETTNYDQFKMIVGNRIVKFESIDFKNLQRSIEKNGQIIPAIVNKDYKIIDGQHRLMACAASNIPFLFIIVEREIPNKSIQIVNTIGKKWTKDDYLNYHVKLENTNYILIQKVVDLYPEFSLTNILSAMNVTSGKSFDIGEAIATEMDVDIANYTLSRIIELKELFPQYKTRSFVSAYIECLRNTTFNHEEFMRKLTIRRLEKQTSIKEYLREIESIYNHGLNKENRIRLY